MVKTTAQYLPLGTPVKICAVYVRSTKGNYGSAFKAWMAKKADLQGFIAGVRTLSSGHRYYDSDEGYSWEPEEYHRAYMVAVDLFTNPVWVPIDAVSPIQVEGGGNDG